jgi:sterol O-acyltransferase
MPVFKHFNKEHLTVKMFVLSILSCQLPGGLLLVIIFYGLLHCWLNAFAEMLRFADRMFYTDWWNSTNYSNYFRTWNIVVHDWLYTYIYKDLHHILGKNNRILCQFLILLLSAIFHEYLITLTLGFFYPIMFPMFAAFGFGFMLIKCDKNSNLGNFLTWLSLQIGFGIQISLYSIEYYVRLNCSQSIESNFLDFILPRSFTCGMNLNSTVSFNHFNREL